MTQQPLGFFAGFCAPPSVCDRGLAGAFGLLGWTLGCEGRKLTVSNLPDSPLGISKMLWLRMLGGMIFAKEDRESCRETRLTFGFGVAGADWCKVNPRFSNSFCNAPGSRE